MECLETGPASGQVVAVDVAVQWLGPAPFEFAVTVRVALDDCDPFSGSMKGAMKSDPYAR
jgi:hypothetical protein